MSTDPTPENLRNCADNCEWSKGLNYAPVVANLRAAADLIEVQQARIEELEAALRSVVDERSSFDGWQTKVRSARALLAASPDTPETQP